MFENLSCRTSWTQWPYHHLSKTLSSLLASVYLVIGLMVTHSLRKSQLVPASASRLLSSCMLETFSLFSFLNMTKLWPCLVLLVCLQSDGTEYNTAAVKCSTILLHFLIKQFVLIWYVGLTISRDLLSLFAPSNSGYNYIYITYILIYYIYNR